MDMLLNTLRGQSGAQDQGVGQARFGVVTSVDPQNGTARVKLQPEGVVTGWLPVLSPWVGAGWGVTCPPTPGDQVLVMPQEGDAEHGLIIARAWSRGSSAPATPVGELWLTHKSGSFVRLVNDGTVRVKGDLHVDGDVHDRHGSLARLRNHYNAHTHRDAQGRTTGLPTPQD